MKNKKLNLIVTTLLIGIILVIPFQNARAQFGIPTQTIEAPTSSLLYQTGAIATSTSAAATTLGTISNVHGAFQASIASGVGLPGDGALALTAPRAAVEASCEPIKAAFDGLSASDAVGESASSTVLSIIGGGAFESAKLSALLAKAIAAKTCVDQYIRALDRVTGDLNILAEVTREQDKYTKISATLEKAIADLSARQNASAKDIAKAFMVKVILNLNKNLTTELVNKLVEKYKISDYLAYGDALASQVYSMKYINENFAGDARQQMMIRSIMQSEKFPEKIKTVQSMANSKAQEYIGKACDVTNPNLDTNDEMYFMKCLAGLGSAQADKNYHISIAIDQAQAATQSGRQSAAAEISQSQGFAPPRNCAGSVSMQADIDAKYEKAETEKSIAEAVAGKLRKALEAKPPTTTPEEYAKAQAAAEQAAANADALRQQGNPIVDICEAIDSPASFVADGIGDFLKTHLNQGSQLSSDNLPFYANFLADVTSNFLTNILTGGRDKSQVLKEAGVAALNGTIVSMSQAISQGGSSTGTTGTEINQASNKVSIVAYQLGVENAKPVTTLAPNTDYRLVVDFNGANDLYRASHFQIEGAVGAAQRFKLSATELATHKIELDFTSNKNPGTFTFTFRFYENNENTPYFSAQQKFTVAGIVNGLETTEPYSAFMPRGPVASLR